jgi:succinate-acetate transporter protein
MITAHHVRQQERTIENVVTRWLIGAIAGLMIVISAVLPWYTAQTTHARATMSGWGQWTVDGHLAASLRPLPFGVFIWVVAAAMIYCAAREMFGGTVLCAMGCFAIGLTAVLGTSLADRRVPDSDSVGIVLDTAPKAIVAVGLLASVVCWIGFARCVLRPAPRAESGA